MHSNKNDGSFTIVTTDFSEKKKYKAKCHLHFYIKINSREIKDLNVKMNPRFLKAKAG